jgi:hypothetical protein
MFLCFVFLALAYRSVWFGQLYTLQYLDLTERDLRSLCNFHLLKGTVARDFWPLVFFLNRPHMGP